MSKRTATYPIDSLFIDRWSPRALSGQSISDEELMTLFEAARWAPSANNSQPWRFIYAKRETEHWDILFNFLESSNQVWAQYAAVLVVIISEVIYNNKPLISHSFDAGAAWQNLALQAHLNNIVAHGIGGFDYLQAKEKLHIPEYYTVEAMIALGKKGKKEQLPYALQQREEPSDRKPLQQIVFEGTFK